MSSPIAALCLLITGLVPLFIPPPADKAPWYWMGESRNPQSGHGSVKVAYDAIEHGSLIVCRR